jgi:hypothetical protein
MLFLRPNLELKGRILAVRREPYVSSGGHSAVADRIHEAVALARSSYGIAGRGRFLVRQKFPRGN